MIWSQLVFKDAQGCRHSQKLMSAMAECTRGDVSAGTLTLEKAVHDVAGYNSMYMNASAEYWLSCWECSRQQQCDHNCQPSSIPAAKRRFGQLRFELLNEVDKNIVRLSCQTPQTPLLIHLL